MHVFSHDKYKIENGSKKTFAIIPKSAKFTKWFSSMNDSQYMVINKVLGWLLGLLGLLYYNTVDDKVENNQPLMYTRNIFYATQGIP